MKQGNGDTGVITREGGYHHLKTGAALSGGGIRGAAHAGVLQALKESGIEVDYISGIETGAAAAAMHAAGSEPEDMLELALSLEKRLTGFRGAGVLLREALPGLGGFVRQGMFKGNFLEQMFERRFTALGISSIRDMKRKLALVAADADTGRQMTFVSDASGLAANPAYGYRDDLPPWVAARAACGIPGVLRPALYRGARYMAAPDGFPLPVAPLKLMGCPRVLAVQLDAGDGTVKEDAAAGADYVLRIKLRGVRYFEPDAAWRCYDAGYRQTQKRIGELVLGLFDE